MKKDKIGYCNICNCFGQITSDHVPPKGASNLGLAELKTLANHISTDSRKRKFYQNGIKFPTLCVKCNNELLGRQYDPALIDISKQVTRLIHIHLSRLLHLPSEITIRIRPHRVARALMGHLLAVVPEDKVGQPIIHAPVPDAMREYFLDQTMPLPSKINIYYWIYPSDLHIVARGLGIFDAISARGYTIGDLIKFFPLSYLITWSGPNDIPFNLPKLISDRSGNTDNEENIQIQFHDVPPLDWPEQPASWGMNLFTDEMTFVAYSRKRQRSKT